MTKGVHKSGTTVKPRQKKSIANLPAVGPAGAIMHPIEGQAASIDDVKQRHAVAAGQKFDSLYLPQT